MKIKYFKVPTALLLCAIAMNQLYSQSGTKDMNNRVEVMIDKEPVIQSSEKKDYSPIIKEQEVKKEKYDLESPDKLILVEYVQGLEPIIGYTFTISWQIIKGVQAIKVIDRDICNSSWV